MNTNRSRLYSAIVMHSAILVFVVNAPAFEIGSVFVGTINEDSDNNEIYQVATDGTVSTFAIGIAGGIDALEFDPSNSYLYALVTRGGGSPIRNVWRFSSDGSRELFTDISPIPAALGSGDTDIEFNTNGSLFLTTSTQNVVELLGGGSGVLRYHGPVGSVYHAFEISKSGDVFLGNRGGDVIHLDSSFANPTTLAHVPVSHFQTDFQAIDTDVFGNLIAMVQDFSTGANIYRIDETGTVTPLAQTANQAGKLAVGPANKIYAVSSHDIQVFSGNGVLLDTIAFSRQLGGIATVIPEPTTSVLSGCALVTVLMLRWAKK